MPNAYYHPSTLKPQKNISCFLWYVFLMTYRNVQFIPSKCTQTKIMAQSLSPTAAATLTSLSTKKNARLNSFRVLAFHQVSHKESDANIVSRRSLALSLAGVAVALNAGNKKANAAARRPPPPPPAEKKDPNVSGVLAKVLASKRRKEAMKESMAKLREKGKPVKEPSE
ncbi:hypothetical protein HAX54_018204 [Datura stramonium]|uniref:Uncharacterized protein n=1 Tax=Datura stramonium TaxID=4076 RepID=A0ABS8UP10_DATST|nr:hypothetical protein [Datura stramonium]